MKLRWLFLALLLIGPALAQDITNHSMPVGGGPGVTGWRVAGPCAINQVLAWTGGATADPACANVGAGTVSSISQGDGMLFSVNPIVGTGTINLFTPVNMTNGGLNASLVASNGGIIYSSATGGAVLNGIPNANMPLLSGAASSPSWSAIRYPTSGTSGGIPYFASATGLSTSNVLTASQIVLGGGAGTAPATLGSLGTTTTVLHGNAAGAPTFTGINLTAGGDVVGTLPVANGGTNCSAASGTCVDNISGFASTGFIKRTGAGTYIFDSASQALQDICATQGNILYFDGADWVCLATGTIGQLLSTNGAGANPSWITASGTGTVTNLSSGNGITLSPTNITTTGTVALTVPVIVANGGTGNTTLTAHNVVIGNGTSPATGSGAGVVGQCIASGGASADPSFISGCPVLLTTLTASASAALSYSNFTSDYTNYIIVLENILNATDATSCRIRVVTTGGTVQTTNYGGSGAYVSNGSAANDSPSTYISCSRASQMKAASAGVNGDWKFYNPSQTSTPKMINGQFVYWDRGNDEPSIGHSAGAYTGANDAVTGFQVDMASGNIASGVVRVYGVK